MSRRAARVALAAAARASASSAIGASRAATVGTLAPVAPRPKISPYRARTDARGFAVAAAPPRTPMDASASKDSDGRSWLSVAAIASPAVVCAFLCKWQLDRYELKKTAIDARETALAAPPLTSRDLADLAKRGEKPKEYAPIALEGTLETSRTVHIAPRTRSVYGSPMPGSVILTAMRPRQPRGAPVVLVNRGWVPTDWEEPKGGTCLKTAGVTRAGETPGFFTPTNAPEKNEWHWVDLPAILRHLGLPENTPLAQVTHDGDGDRGTSAPTSYPAPVALADVRVFKVSPSDHVNYAATWGSLCVATAGLGAYAVFGGKGGGGAKKAAKNAARAIGG
jgi:surfeit locus 1 family protein